MCLQCLQCLLHLAFVTSEALVRVPSGLEGGRCIGSSGPCDRNQIGFCREMLLAQGGLSPEHKECGFGTSVSKMAENFGVFSVAASVRIWNRLRSIVRKSASFFWRRWALQ